MERSESPTGEGPGAAVDEAPPAVDQVPPPVDEAPPPVDEAPPPVYVDIDVDIDGAGDGELDEYDVDDEAAAQQLLDDLDRLQSERDDYLDQLRRTRADFENYRKRMVRQQTEHLERAAESLVEKLLEVLDVYGGATAHGEGFEQVGAHLVKVLEKEGLERIDPVGDAFDPKEADAVAHEDGEAGPVVAEVLRPGYRWKGKVLRPAMVKVRG